MAFPIGLAAKPQPLSRPWWTLAAAASLGQLALPATAQTAATGSLKAAFAAESTVMDPFKYSAGVDQYYISQMFEQLVRPDPALNNVNWLAEKWEVNDNNGKPIIDITIRKGVKFHNGDALTSADFEFSYQKLKDPKVSRWSHLQAAVERFEIVDAHRFKLHFKTLTPGAKPQFETVMKMAGGLGLKLEFHPRINRI